MKKNLLYLLVASVFLFTGCNNGGSSGSNVTFEADAGSDQNVTTGEIVTLDASDSYTSSSLTLSYTWEFASVPSGSSAVLSDPDSVKPSFSADVDGIYIVNVVVSDSLGRSNIDSVTITASSGNSAPVADAGVDQNVSIGALVTLDGSGSSDANSDPLTYMWSFFSTPNGVNVILNGETTAKPSFNADVEGSYDVQLIVNDGTTDGVPDIVTIIASAVNSAPVADAGVNQNVSTGNTVTLDGSGSSDADNDLLTYFWSIISTPPGSAASLSDNTLVSPTFVTDLDGSYVVQLIVNDGTVDSVPETVTITASTANSTPVANAGADQNVSTGATVTLDGSGSSDADTDPLSYAWSFTSVPPGSSASFSDTSVVNPTFVADLDGTYVARLTVNDGLLDSAAVSVTVTASTANSTPVANAGADQSVDTGDTVTLDGSGSSDADSDPLTYNWTLSSRPATSTATLSDPTAEQPTFDADVAGDYVAQLTVNDGTVDSVPDAVTVTTTNPTSAGPVGALDTTFDGDGIVVYDEAGNDDSGNDIVLDSSGNIFVTGFVHFPSTIGNDDDMAIWKYDSSGALDPTFGSAGMVTDNNVAGGSLGYENERGNAITLDSLGNVYVTGFSLNTSNDLDMVIWKYTQSGVLDNSFGVNGVVVHNNAAGGNGSDYGRAIALDGNGSIYVAGESFGTDGDPDMAIWKYTDTGVLDNSFGGGGIVTHHSAAGGSHYDIAYGIAIDSTGNIYVTGESFNSSINLDMVIWKYDQNGNLVSSFDNDGILVYTGANNQEDSGQAIVLDDSDNIFVAGYSNIDHGAPTYSSEDMAIWKFNSNGIPDNTFGIDGMVAHNGAAGLFNDEQGNDITIDALGNIYVTGFGRSDVISHFNDMVLWKYTGDGQLDTSFDNDGFLSHHNAAGGDNNDFGNGVAVDNSGNIYVTGESYNSSLNLDMVIWKYE